MISFTGSSPQRPAWIGLGLTVLLLVSVAPRHLTADQLEVPTAPLEPARPELSPEVNTETTAPTECLVGVILAGEAVDVVARSEGTIVGFQADIGDRVERNQVLAVLDAEDLRHELRLERARLGAALAEAERSALEADQARAENERRVGLQDLVSAQDLETSQVAEESARLRHEARQAQVEMVQARIQELTSRIERTQVRAPFDGLVAARYLDSGAVAGSGTALMRLVHSTERRVRFAVPPEDLEDFGIGASIRVETGAHAAETTAVVDRVAPEVDEPSQMIFVEAAVATDDGATPIAAGADARVSREGSSAACTGPEPADK